LKFKYGRHYNSKKQTSRRTKIKKAQPTEKILIYLNGNNSRIINRNSINLKSTIKITKFFYNGRRGKD
jgi:hypothetical protein